MLNRLSKTTKIAILGASALGFGGLAIYQINRPQNNLQSQLKNQINNTISKASPQIQRAALPKQHIIQPIVNQNNPHHQHDTDIRVLDMVGFPAVHGTNILQQRQQQKVLPSNLNTVIPIIQILQQPKKTMAQTQTAKVQQKKKKIVFNKIKQIPVFDQNKQISLDDYVLIVGDLEYNQGFQKQIISKLTHITKKRKASKPLSIYRLHISDPSINKQFTQKFGEVISQQTILLLKNPYENQFINIDFKTYMQSQSLPAIYLSQLKQINSRQQLKKQLTKMTPNDTYLLYAVDSEKQPNLKKKKAMAKYLELQLGNQRMQNIKVCLVDSKIAKQQGILSKETPDDSLNLIRKSNQFTYKTPNRWLYNLQPFHVIQNISLFDKQKNNLIPRYLGRVQTFNSLKIDSPYICQIKIDRNRTSPKQQREIFKVFAHLKQNKQFPMVSYILKFGEVDFKGQHQDPFSNKKFIVKMANIEQIDKQSMMHQIKDNQDTKWLGIKQRDWLQDTFQYLYRQPEVTYQGIYKFIRQTIDGNYPQFYKSQAKFKLQHVDKVTSSTFNEKILSNQNQSHVIFQYSDHCQACQLLSPLIQQMNDAFKKFPQIGIDVHALNCDKNRVKGQPYSPYTPNLYIYSKNWGNKIPLRYPLVQNAKYNSIFGIYNFCTITDQLKKIDQNKLEDHIKNVSENKVKLTDF